MKHIYTDRLIDCRIILFYENMCGCKMVQLMWYLRNNIALNQDAMKRKLDGTNPFLHRCYVTVTNQFMEQSWESNACSSLNESNHLLWNQHSIAALVDFCFGVLSRHKSEHLKTLCFYKVHFSIILSTAAFVSSSFTHEFLHIFPFILFVCSVFAILFSLLSTI